MYTYIISISTPFYDKVNLQEAVPMDQYTLRRDVLGKGYLETHNIKVIIHQFLLNIVLKPLLEGTIYFYIR